MNITNVILVDTQDREIGLMEKMEAHQKGLLHRAFSVFIFDYSGNMLLQQRALTKYHSPGLWTNACCSHPAPGEQTLRAANRRLYEELGFTCLLTENGSFTYKTNFDNGLTEHEFDHVFSGTYKGPIYPDKNEVEQYKWIQLSELEQDLIYNKENYTSWFQIAYPLIKKWLSLNPL